MHPTPGTKMVVDYGDPQPPLVRRLPDLDPKARYCVAAIALLMLAARKASALS